MVANLNNLDRRAGVTELLISESERDLELKLPDDYLAFLKTSNGGEGFVGNNYVMLWKIDELSSMNRSYETEVNAPGLLLLGQTAGGRHMALTRASCSGQLFVYRLWVCNGKMPDKSVDHSWIS